MHKEKSTSYSDRHKSLIQKARQDSATIQRGGALVQPGDKLRTQQLANLHREIADLNRALSARDHQIAAMLNSTSWRITKPLRRTGDRLRKYRRLLKALRSAVRHSEGLVPVLKKAWGIYQRQGLIGLKRVLGQLTAASTSASIITPAVLAKKTITHDADILLESSVLIIAELSIPQCTKYRVTQKKEMLDKLGISCSILSWTEEEKCFDALSTHSIVFFYRVPGGSSVLALIEEAKRLKVRTYWEVDDLIFDRELLAKNSSLAALDAHTVHSVLDGADLYRRAMLSCDAGIASTTGLRVAMLEAGVPEAIVIENALDRQTLLKAQALNKKSKHTDGILRIVYGSGTNTHNVDFLAASNSILQILAEFPNASFRAIGPLELPAQYENYSAQIERIAFCTYEEYLQLLSECDISIAPLEDSVFNDAKSNIKFLEASAVRVPSICSSRSAFRTAITDGETGFLCETEDEWLSCLRALVNSGELRTRVGKNAWEYVVNNYDVEAIANRELKPLLSKHSIRLKNKIRVLSVNVLYEPRSFGGATIVVEETNKILRGDESLEIYVFTTLPLSIAPAYSVRRYEAHGVSVFGMGLPDTADAHLQFENEQVTTAFERVIMAVAPDIVHFHSIQGIGVSVADLCKSQGIPYIVTLHDAWWLCGRQFMVNRNGKYCEQEKIDFDICAQCMDDSYLNSYRQAKLSSVLNNAKLLLAPSIYFANFYKDNGFDASKVVVNKNGVHKPNSIKKIKLDGPLRFGYVGGNTEVKGIKQVLKAFSQLKSEDIKLIIVDNMMNLGFPSYKEDFIKNFENAEIVPAYTQDTIDDFFASIDVLLFPTQAKESFGLAVREALARNVWVITSDAGGVVEDIIPGKNGLIIPFNDDGTALEHSIRSTMEYFEQYESGAEVLFDSNHISWFDDQAKDLSAIYRRIARFD